MVPGVRVLWEEHWLRCEVVKHGTFTIGAADGADVRVGDRSLWVAPTHAEVELRDGEVHLADRSGWSKALVFEGRARSEVRAPVKDRPTVKLGRVAVTFQPAPDAPDSSDLDRWHALGPGPVVVRGPRGAGRLDLVRAMHERTRPGTPLVVVDGDLLPSALVEAALRGSITSSYTSGLIVRRGAFEIAAQGTLVLAAVEQLPRDLQPHVGRWLASGSYRPVGGTGARLALTASVVATTEYDLVAWASRGDVAEDLQGYFGGRVLDVAAPSPPEGVEASLLAAIAAAPEDDAPRLVLGDHLLARGDPRGEFIQVQCRAEPIADAEAALLAAHAETWTAPVLQALRRCADATDITVTFARGFVDTVRGPIDLLRGVDALVAAAPTLRGLTLEGPMNGDELALTSPRLLRLRALHLRGDRLRAPAAAAIASCPHLAELRTLALPGLEPDAWEPFLEALALPALVTLRVDGEGPPDLGARLASRNVNVWLDGRRLEPR